MAERLTKTEGRQGERGKSVLWVLVGSMVLMVVALFGLMTWNGSSGTKDYASQSQDASRREVTGSSGASSANSSGVPGGNPAYPAPAQATANGPK